MNDQETLHSNDKGSTTLRNVRFASDGEYAWAYGETVENGEIIPILVIPKMRIADLRNGISQWCKTLTKVPLDT
jgi:hypothetical protein